MTKEYNFLHTYISKNGFEKLTSSPFPVYKALLKGGITPRAARLVLITLLCGTVEKAREGADMDTLTSFIQKENGLTKKEASSLAELYHSLFSPENEQTWENDALQGFEEFCKNSYTIEWEGRCEWHTKFHSSYPCRGDATLEFSVKDSTLLKKHLSDELRSNPFLTEEDIYGILLEEICSDLDRDFEEYCNGDDYYEPYLEEFVGEGTYKSEEEWKSWGLEILSFEGSGDVDFEPY